MIPFIGTLIGILPVFLVILLSDNSFSALGVLFYKIFLVSSTDNSIRLFLLKKLNNIHLLISLIGVIVGVPLFGFIKLIFESFVISLFLVIVRVYRKEFCAQQEIRKVL
jgi:predicted PurR-regulated permease PerM